MNAKHIVQIDPAYAKAVYALELAELLHQHAMAMVQAVQLRRSFSPIVQK